MGNWKLFGRCYPSLVSVVEELSALSLDNYRHVVFGKRSWIKNWFGSPDPHDHWIVSTDGDRVTKYPHKMSGPRKNFRCEVMVLKVTRIDEHSVIRLWLTFKFLHRQKTRKSFVTCCIKLQLECRSCDIVPNPYPVILSGSRNTPHATMSDWEVLTCLQRPRVVTIQSLSLSVLPRVNVTNVFMLIMCY